MPPEWLDTSSAPPGGMFCSPRTSERKYRLRNGLVMPITRSVRPGSHFVSSDGSISVEAMRAPLKLERVLVMVPEPGGYDHRRDRQQRKCSPGRAARPNPDHHYQQARGQER